MFHEPTIRKHISLVQHHVSKAQGYRDAGQDASGEEAEAVRNLKALANAMGHFCDPTDDAAQTAVEGLREAAE